MARSHEAHLDAPKEERNKKEESLSPAERGLRARLAELGADPRETVFVIENARQDRGIRQPLAYLRRALDNGDGPELLNGVRDQLAILDERRLARQREAAPVGALLPVEPSDSDEPGDAEPVVSLDGDEPWPEREPGPDDEDDGDEPPEPLPADDLDPADPAEIGSSDEDGPEAGDDGTASDPEVSDDEWFGGYKAGRLTCGWPGCGAHYVNDEEGWAAHLAVFGHAPGSDDEEPEQEES
jgi:hypothetical protein